MKNFQKNKIYVVTSTEGHVRRSFRFTDGEVVYNYVIYDVQGCGYLNGPVKVTDNVISAKDFGGEVRQATKEEMYKHINIEHKYGFLISRVKDLCAVTHRGGWATYFMPGAICLSDENGSKIFKEIVKLGIKHFRPVHY